jgi:peptide/nickel transport system ATP-binding protein
MAKIQSENFTPAVLSLAGNFGASGKGDVKPLLSIRNLKQYFPVKGHKNMFVKANDGITIEIFEGETLGLVGESGCGKSTFGRVLLQLYRQTQGRTLFYGRALDTIAPLYLRDSIKSLPRAKQNLLKLYDKNLAAAAELEAAQGGGDDKQKFRAMEEAEKSRKAAEDAFLDLVHIFGGLLLYANEEELIAAYLEYYHAAAGRNSIKEEIAALELEKTEAGANSGPKPEKVNSLEAKISERNNALVTAEEELKLKLGAIDALRRTMKGNEDFEKLERLRDDGIDLARLNYNEMRLLRRDMQLIFQDPYSSLNPRLTVGQIIGEGPLAHDFFSGPGEALQKHVLAAMDHCGLAPYMIHRYPHQFSGGQRQRIGIARALAVGPKFIVCDEAVSALDVSIQSQILNLLSELKEKQGLTYLFISHDLSVIKYVSDRVGVMYLGNIVELAASEEIFRHQLHPYTEALLSAIPTTRTSKPRESIILEGDIPSPINPPKGCKFHTRCRYVTEICGEVTPELKEMQPGHFAACHHCL